MQDDDELNMSIMSLKHITNEELKEGDDKINQKQQQQLDKNNDRNSTTTNTLNNINQNLNTASPTPKNSQAQINTDLKTLVFNPNSSCSSFTYFNKFSITEFGALLNSNNVDFPIDQNSVGANFLRQMFTSNQPMKNYMNFLKKDSVDLTDERDAMVVMQILQKQNKSKNECNFLMKSIQGMHLFQKNKDMLTMKDCNQQLLEKLKLEYFPARKTIFNYGDFGYTYYIVLQGGADLLIPAPVQEKEGDKQKQGDQNSHRTTQAMDNKDEKKHSNDQEGFTHNNVQKKGKKKIKLDSKWNVLKKTFHPDQENMPLQELQSPVIDEEQPSLLEDESHDDFLKRVFPNMNYIKTFKAGEAFGEIALMTKQRRTGTLICREGTYLMALTKESFDVILGAYHENIIQRKLNFLKTYNFFRSMPNSKLLALLHFMKVVNYRNKNIVYTENDPSRFLYFIREGEVQISQICNIEENLDKEKKKKLGGGGDDNLNEINAIKAQKDLRNKNKRIPIVIKGKNSYFGEDEILKHIDTRKQQAICSSESAEIFLLKKDILYNYTRGYSVIEKLKEEFKVKGEWNQIRKANIVQVKQTTKFDLEKQMNQLSAKVQRPSITLSNISETKGLDYKQQSSNTNIFSLNQNKPSQQTNLSGSISMCNINVSASKRLSIQNTSQTPSQQQTLTNSTGLDTIDFMTSKQRLSLRTNPFNPNSLSTIQKQLELNANSKIRPNNHSTSSSEETENFFSTGIGQFSVNGFINNDKLTPENKVQLQFKSLKKGQSYYQAQLGGQQNQSNGFESDKLFNNQQMVGQNLTEEEKYIENKIMNNLKKKYYGECEKSKEELQQVAIEQFGDISHNAFVNKVGQTLEYKMQILKKLNSKRVQSPTNIFSDLYEEFGLKKNSVSTSKRRNIYTASPMQGSTPNSINTPNQTKSKTFSAPNGHEFQKKILQERKMQIKENIKRHHVQNYIEDVTLINEQLSSDATTPHKSRTFHQQYSYVLSDPNSETFIRQKSRTNTSILLNQNQPYSLNQKRLQDKTKSFDEVSLSGYESQSSQSSISYSKRNSFNEKGFKAPSLALIKNLDVLEEVSENNSPLKSNNDLKQYRYNSNQHDLKSLCQQEYGISNQQGYQQKSQSRILIENINSCGNQLNEGKKNGSINFEIKPQSSSLLNNCNSDNSNNQNSQMNTYYSTKSFMNRNKTSLKQKQDARKSIMRNSSANSKENSFKITTKYNGFNTIQKNVQMFQSQGNLQSRESCNNNN